MSLKLIPLKLENLTQFKKDMQESFQQGAVDGFSDVDTEILPENDIDLSLSVNGSFAYEAWFDEKLVGGAIVVVNNETQHNHLDFLYVNKGSQSKGLGQIMWNEIEKLYPDTIIWETHTPYFEKRNIHFYVNKCGFHIVEYYNKFHKDPNEKEEAEQYPENNYFEGFFRLEKYMK